MLHDLPDIAIALIVLGAFVLVWRAEGDDPIWRERWRALSPADRARIAAAARSGSLLASDEEIELAAGYARRDRRRRRPTRLIAALDVPAGILLILGGIVTGAVLFSAAGVLFLLTGLYRLHRARQIGHALRETISRNHTNRIE